MATKRSRASEQREAEAAAAAAAQQQSSSTAPQQPAVTDYRASFVDGAKGRLVLANLDEVTHFDPEPGTLVKQDDDWFFRADAGGHPDLKLDQTTLQGHGVKFVRFETSPPPPVLPSFLAPSSFASAASPCPATSS